MSAKFEKGDLVYFLGSMWVGSFIEFRGRTAVVEHPDRSLVYGSRFALKKFELTILQQEAFEKLAANLNGLLTASGEESRRDDRVNAVSCRYLSHKNLVTIERIVIKPNEYRKYGIPELEESDRPHLGIVRRIARLTDFGKQFVTPLILKSIPTSFE